MLKITHYDEAGRSVADCPDYQRPSDPFAGKTVILRMLQTFNIDEEDNAKTKASRLFPGLRLELLPSAVKFVIVTGTITQGASIQMYYRKYKVAEVAYEVAKVFGPVGTEIEGQEYPIRVVLMNPWNQTPVLLFTEELPDTITGPRISELIAAMTSPLLDRLPFRHGEKIGIRRNVPILPSAYRLCQMQPVTEQSAVAKRVQITNPATIKKREQGVKTVRKGRR